MDRPALARVELERVIELARIAKAAGPPCCDCAYGTGQTCRNPAYLRQTFEPSTGKITDDYPTSLKDARAAEGLCGPEALLFEPTPPPNIVRGVGEVLAKGSWFAVKGAAYLLAGSGFIVMVLDLLGGI